MRYRPFRNSDPPELVSIWNRQPPLRGLAQPISLALFDQLVLSKPYFDGNGLIIAEDDNGLHGLAHAGFGPNDNFTDLDVQMGITCILMVQPREDQSAIGTELLVRCEDYLRAKGSQIFYGGPIFPMNPFYLGLYGGSELPGVLMGDERFCDVLKAANYDEIDRCVILHLNTDDFRPVSNRQQLSVRRTYHIESSFDPPASDWWDACTTVPTEHVRFELFAEDQANSCARVTFWNMDAFSKTWRRRVFGMVKLQVDKGHRQKGLATYLTGEAIKQLKSFGVSLIEVQTMQGNKSALKLYRKLGFQEVDQGIVFRKSVAG